MKRPLSVPRRAWQRRGLHSAQAIPSAEAQERPAKRRQGPPRSGTRQGHCDDSDSSFVLGSQSESDSSEDDETDLCRPEVRTTQSDDQVSGCQDGGRRDATKSVLTEPLGASSASEPPVVPSWDPSRDLNDEDDDRAGYYDELLTRFRAEGPALANHGRNTEKMVQEQGAKWNEFCRYRNIDPVRALGHCEAPLFKLYLVWRVENSRIKKESSVMTYWKVLSMVYARTAAGWMSEALLYDVRNWIHKYLTPTYSLDTSRKEKAGIFVDDLLLLLTHHWIRDREVYTHERFRVQLAANLVLAGATATRPGALIGQLRYEHLEFQLFPPLAGHARPRLVLKVNLAHVKRSGGRSDPKEFAFREDDMLLYDPLIPIMALAFADGAFANRFAGPDDIYRLVVPANADRLRVRWKDEWRRRPVFRDVEEGGQGLRIALDRPLRYQRERRHLLRLGRSIGLAKALEWYDLRRGSGKKLNENLTPEERNKIMGHRQGDSKVYVQYYMSTFNDVDCQSICFGSAPQRDLVHLAGRLLRHGDAPTALSDRQRREVGRDPQLMRYRAARTRALQEMKRRGYRTRADAEGTEMAATYDDSVRKAHSLANKLKSERLRRAIKEFHESVHIDEINRQLRGVRTPDVIAPPALEYDLPERARAARLFSRAAAVSSRDELHPLRIQLIETLTRLCQRRESPRSRQEKTARTPPGALDLVSAVHTKEAEPTASPSKMASWSCPFCRWTDEAVGARRRAKLWRIDSLARHIRTIHLRDRCVAFQCPYDGCTVVLEDVIRFAQHVAEDHGLRLPDSVLKA